MRNKTMLRGSFEDSGKYARCYNCGFIVNLDRDVGDPERANLKITDAIVKAQTLEMGGTNPISTLETLNGVGVMLENNAAGSAITDYYTPRLPTVNRGCPFCGAARF
jgi:hypothetical protein